MKLCYASPNQIPPCGDGDILVFSEALDERSESAIITAAQNADAFVFRTFPESSGYIDPLTLEASWADFGCFAVKAEALDAAGGFDMRLGSAAATDMVWRLKTLKKKTVFVSGARAKAEIKPSYADRLIDVFLLRCKYGTLKDILDGKLLIMKAVRRPDAYGVRGEGLLARFAGSSLTAWGLFLSKSGGIKGEFHGADYCLRRGEYESSAPDGKAVVSFAIRTCGRPEKLRDALTSVRNQSYRGVEAVVVEDGPATAEEMIKNEFSDLNVSYIATGKNIGRSAAANLAFSRCTGDYINLLDDDDFLLPDHTELLLGELQKSGLDFIISGGIALETDRDGTVRNKRPLVFPRVDEFTMTRQCLVTENGEMFKRDLLSAAGGMREDIDSHEDWNLWLRFMSKGSFGVLPYITCCYVVPAEAERERERLEKYAAFDDALLEDDSLVYTLTAKQLKGFYDGTIHDLMYLKQRGELDGYIESEYKRITGERQ